MIDLTPLHPQATVGEVLGTASIAAPDGSVSARLEVLYGHDNTIVLSVADAHNSLPTSLSLRLFANADLPIGCSENYGGNFGTSPFTDATTLSEPVTQWDAGITADPSWLQTAAIVVASDWAEAGSCPYEFVVATGTITWSPVVAHDPIVVTQGGRDTGALGEVTVEEGKPVRYVVVPEDTFAAVASRFGISVAELRQLNPRRNPGAELQRGETLNLVDAPAARSVYLSPAQKFQ